MKGPMTLNEFMNVIKRITEYQTRIKENEHKQEEEEKKVEIPKRKTPWSQYIYYVTKRKKLIFELNSQDLLNYDEPKTCCFYCGISRRYVVLGIDRMNSQLGYVRENCVPCCSQCNYMKRELLPEEFKQHVYSLYNYFVINSKLSDEYLKQLSQDLWSSSICDVDGFQHPRRIRSIESSLPVETLNMEEEVICLSSSPYYHELKCIVIMDLDGKMRENTVDRYKKIKLSEAIELGKIPCRRCRKEFLVKENDSVHTTTMRKLKCSTNV
jgi:hypothetical protein